MAEFLRESGDGSGERNIQASSFGGLNTVATPVNLPYTDSPYLLNLDVGIAGHLTKRKGTKFMATWAKSHQGASFTPVTTSTGIPLVVSKEGTGFSVYIIQGNDQWLPLFTKTNVFSTRASSVTPNVVVTNEVQQRAIFFTGVDTPVQLVFSETSTTVTAGGPKVVTITDEGGTFTNLASGNYVVFINGQPTSLTASWAGNVISIGSHTYPADCNLSVMMCTWQWWAEADYKLGERYFDSVTRLNTTTSDMYVAVPERLRDDISRDTGVNTGYRMYASSDQTPDSGWYTQSSRPTGANEYCWSNGVFWNRSDANDRPTYSPTFCCFGANGNAVTSLYIARARRLTFNGGQGITPANIQCYTGSNAIGWTRKWPTPDSTSGRVMPYRFTMHTSTNWNDSGGTTIPTPVNPLSSPNTVCDHVMFRNNGAAAGNYKGIPPLEGVYFANAEPKWCGTEATATFSTVPKDGCYVMVPGIQAIANYRYGVFPTFGCMYAGRLIIGGSLANPMRILVSAVSGYEAPLSPLMDFTVDAFTTKDTDPFDFEFLGAKTDYLVGAAEWAGSLFVFSKERTYRLLYREALTFSDARAELVGTAGAVNAQSIVLAGSALLFLSNSGVYQVIPAGSLADIYELKEISIKIAPMGDSTPEERRLYSRAFYDSIHQRVFFTTYLNNGSPSFQCDLWVLFLKSGAWSKYASVDPFGPVFIGSVLNAANQQVNIMVTVLGTNYLSALRMDVDVPMDWQNTVANPGVSCDTGVVYYTPSQTIVSSAGVQRYSHRIPCLDLEDVEDLSVTYDGVPLEFKKDWYKLSDKAIYLNVFVSAGKNVVITERNVSTGSHPYRVYRNNVLMPQDNTALVPTGDPYTRTVNIIDETGIVPTDTILVGNLYPCVYKSPYFNEGLLKRLKRGLHWYGYMSNIESQEVWGVGDLAPGQDPGELVGFPKVNTDFNVSFLWNHERDGDTSYDQYGAGELIWDESVFDSGAQPFISSDYTVLKVPIFGVGYGLQFCVWNWSEHTLSFTGYQIDTKLKGQRYKLR